MTEERIKTLRTLELCLEGPDDLEINLPPRIAIKAIIECLDEIERLRTALTAVVAYPLTAVEIAEDALNGIEIKL